MSMPHTGKLKAIVKGVSCNFDGNRWDTDDAALSRRLNDATNSSPKTHFTIRELAKHILQKTELSPSSEILTSESDQWDSEIPENAED